MGMVVRTNTMSVNAYRQLGMNSNSVSKSLEKLSSGFRINRAGDDASGLAISEKMKAQINGLEQAAANAQDGISLIQTAEGATTEIHNMLNRMVTLATKSSNGTIQDEVDRDAIQTEVDALKTEITRIAKSTNFNGINLLDGSLSGNGTAASGGLTGGIAFTYKAATTGIKAGADMSDAAFTSKDKITVDGTEIEVDWSKLSTEDRAALKIDWTTAANSDNTKKAASVMEKAINEAIDSANAAKGSNVAHVTVKGGVAGTNGTFEIVSGLQGNADSSVAITTANAATLGAMLGSAVTGTTSTAPQTGTTTEQTFGTDGKVTIAASGATLANTGISMTGEQVAANEKLINALKNDGVKITSTATNTVVSLNGYTLKDGTTEYSGSGVAWATATSAKTLDIYDGDTKVGELAVTFGAAATAADTTGVTVKFDTGTPAAGTIGQAGGNITAAATDKFAGDVSEVNGKSIDMMLDGEKFNVNLAGFVANGDGSDDTTNAAALKSSIDAALQNYATAKGMSADETTTLKASITVDVSKTGQFAITNTSSMNISFADKDGNKAAQVLGISREGSLANVGGLTLQVGDTNDDFNKVTVSIDDLSAEGLGIANLKVDSEVNAGAAIKTIRTAINKVSTNRGNLGALQNRLEYTINNLDTTNENMTAANSRIRDTDMAKEMMNYTKMNILTQAAQAMLAQANQQPQSILQLLQ